MANQNEATQTVDDLKDLAKQIIKSHKDCLKAARSSLTHAVNAGASLIKAKAAVAHGGWKTWVEENCRIGLREAQRYMKVAKELGKLAEQGLNINEMTLTEALGHLKKTQPKAVSEAAAREDVNDCFRLSSEDRDARLTRIKQSAPALPESVENEVAAVLKNIMVHFKRSIRTAVVKKIGPKIEDASVDVADIAIMVFSQLRDRLDIAVLFDEPQSEEADGGSAATTEADSATSEQPSVTSAA